MLAMIQRMGVKNAGIGRFDGSQQTDLAKICNFKSLAHFLQRDGDATALQQPERGDDKVGSPFVLQIQVLPPRKGARAQ